MILKIGHSILDGAHSATQDNDQGGRKVQVPIGHKCRTSDDAMVPAAASKCVRLLKQQPSCRKDQSQRTGIDTPKDHLDRLVLSHGLPKRNDGVLQDQTREEDGEVSQEGAYNTALVRTNHRHSAQETCEIEVGSWERLDQGQANEELFVVHPARVNSVGSQEWDDDGSTAKDNGSCEIKGCCQGSI